VRWRPALSTAVTLRRSVDRLSRWATLHRRRDLGQCDGYAINRSLRSLVKSTIFQSVTDVTDFPNHMHARDEKKLRPSRERFYRAHAISENIRHIRHRDEMSAVMFPMSPRLTTTEAKGQTPNAEANRTPPLLRQPVSMSSPSLADRR